MTKIIQLRRAWYALHTRSRFENTVNDRLLGKSVEVFLPKTLVRSKRVDRKKMIRIPLFAGYLFVRTDLNPKEHLEILKTAGAVHFVGNSEGPIPVSDESIESLKIMAASDKEIVTGIELQEGDPVTVIRGPLAGITGFFVRYKGDTGRVIVNISALGRFAAAEVEKGDIQALPEISSDILS